MGICLAFFSLPFAGKEPIRFDRAGKKALKGALWGLSLFLVYGVTDFMFKVQAEFVPSVDPKAFMTSIFGTALVLTLPRLKHHRSPLRPCLLWGVALGVNNLLATYFWIMTLDQMPGTIAYPILGVGIILMTTLISLALWKETLRPANWACLVMACFAVFLINT